MSKVYSGVDPSLTNTGVVSVYNDEVKATCFKTDKVPNDNAGETKRMCKWYETVDQILGKNHQALCDTFWCECDTMDGIEVPMGNHFGGASKVDRLFGYFIGRLSTETDNYMVFTPSQIKKFFTGSGRADKETMVWFANKVWDFPCTSHDIADAFAIAKMTQYIDENLYEL